jgi:hypothetical protein
MDRKKGENKFKSKTRQPRNKGARGGGQFLPGVEVKLKGKAVPLQA